MANLLVCCDGTWNTPDDLEGGLPASTNVSKLFNALADADKDGVKQKKYYHPGVGTDGGIVDWVVGGGTGKGLDGNIQSAYQWLGINYAAGDNIFLNGFSRGAYTARSLAGMISHCGLLDLSDPALSTQDIWDRVGKAYACYRAGQISSDLKKLKFHNCAPGAPSAGTTKIFCVGVWDTVGALGIPDDLALLNQLDVGQNYEFHDTDLSDNILNARHAMAIDEHRQAFVPTLWTNVEGRKNVRQVWFPGVHCDVGGGYAQTGLSDGSLKWMMDELRELGLNFRAGIEAQINPNPLGAVHDSVTSVFKALATAPRGVPCFMGKDAASCFHASALERYRNPPIQQPPYWPTQTLAAGEASFDIFARERWNATGLYLEDGATYDFAAAGEWMDRDIKCSPDGSGDDSLHLQQIGRILLNVAGQFEGLWRKYTKNDQAHFQPTKRVEEIEWFALVGVLANGIGANVKGKVVPHKTFRIGKGTTLKVGAGEGGYLYCFANDAWPAYGDNKGSVRLTVKRTA